MTGTAGSGGGSYPKGKRLTPTQIATLMRRVGFVQPHAPHGTTPGWDPNSYAGDAVVTTGVAIVYAESGGNPWAVHHNSNGSTDYGLWQINDHAHPELFKRFDWRDPEQNTRMAKIVWQQAQGFTPWVTYNNNSYKLHEGKGQAGLNGAIANYQHAQSPQVQLGGLPGFSTLGDLIGWFGDAHNWLRVAEVIGGSVAVLIGLYLLAETGTVPGAKTVADTATKTAKTAAKAAALA